MVTSFRLNFNLIYKYEIGLKGFQLGHESLSIFFSIKDHRKFFDIEFRYDILCDGKLSNSRQVTRISIIGLQ